MKRILLLSMMMFALFAYGEDIKLLTKRAEKGDAEAQNDLGLKYAYGDGVAIDYAQAYYWFKKSAEQGNIVGQGNLGWCFYYGYGVEQNYEQAYYWFKKSAERGSAYSQNYLGSIYYNGLGTQQNFEQAAYWFRKSAEQGDEYSMNGIGLCYYKGEGVEQDYKQSFSWYMKSALKGNSDAQCTIGFMYYLGLGVEIDYEQFVSWTKKAAEQGNGMAQSNLGHLFYSGKGVLRDYQQAYYWFKQSADQGNASGQSGLGGLYETGCGVQQDYTQAVYWYKKAADQGYYGGLSSLAYCYLKGLGVQPDYAQAVELFNKALIGEKENLGGYSLARLGLCYEYGYGVNRDTRQAYEYYQKAASMKQDNSLGLAGLGSCYENGYGVVQDYSQAIEYYQKALEDSTGIERLEERHEVKMRLQNLLALNSKDSKKVVQPSQLPILDFIAGSLAFVDKTGNNAIDANGQYMLRMQVKNIGKGIAQNCMVKVSKKGSTNGITVDDLKLPNIAVGEIKTIEVPIVSGVNTANGQIEFGLQVDEPNGFGIDPQYITVKPRAFETPYIEVTDYSITSSGGQVLKKKVPFDLQLMLQNTKSGLGEDIEVSIVMPDNVLLLEGKQKEHFATMKGGEANSLVYSLIVNNNYDSPTIPIKVQVKEKYGKYGADRVVTLKLDQSMASTKISVDAAKREQSAINIAKLNVDVEVDIPENAQDQQKTFAVIISNEHYSQVANVPFAQKDGEVFGSYCRSTLGIPQYNIRSYTDATYGQMLMAMKDIKSIAQAYNGDLNIIFYYAGHGVPNEATRDAYLLPVDAEGMQTETCYSVSKLYKELGGLGAKNVVVFMDACFTGSQRGDGMLASARGVALKAKSTVPQGNMVVFSAASGDETAYPYKEKGHGLFTYFLLKKLQESKGDCTLGELGEYIQTNVRQQSVVINRKSQTPTVVPSPSVSASWKAIKLR